MREAAGFVLFHLSLAVAGAALLYALGLVRPRPRDLAVAAGPGLFCGVALVIPLQIAAIVVGLPNGLPLFAVVAAGSTGALVALAVVRGHRGAGDARTEPPAARDALDRWTVRGAVLILALFLLFGARAFTNLPTVEDDVNIWSTKAVALFHYDGVHNEVFHGEAYNLSHRDYPILQPLFEATFYRARGGDDLALAHLELWILFGSFVWTAAFLLRSRVRPVWWLAPIAALAVAPAVYEQVRIGYADVSVAAFAAAGLLALGLWVERRRTGHLVLAAVLLGAAANTKNEGLVAVAVGALAAACVLVSERRRPQAVPLVAAAAALVASVVPWRVWTLAEGYGLGSGSGSVPAGEPPPSEPGLTAVPDGPGAGGPPGGGGGGSGSGADGGGPFERAFTALDGVFTQLSHQGRWLWILPAAIVIAGAALYDGRGRRLAAYYGGATAGIVGVVLFTYWTGDNSLPSELGGGVDRIVSTTVFVAAVAAAHLLAIRAAAGEEEPPEP